MANKPGPAVAAMAMLFLAAAGMLPATAGEPMSAFTGYWRVARVAVSDGGVQALGDDDPSLMGKRLTFTTSQLTWDRTLGGLLYIAHARERGLLRTGGLPLLVPSDKEPRPLWNSSPEPVHAGLRVTVRSGHRQNHRVYQPRARAKLRVRCLPGHAVGIPTARFNEKNEGMKLKRRPYDGLGTKPVREIFAKISYKTKAC